MKTICVLFVLAACTGPGNDQDLPPVAHDDTVTTAEDTPFGLHTLTQNDEHVDKVRQSDIVEMPQHGVISSIYNSWSYSDELSYVPQIGYHGPDRFTYRGSGLYGVPSDTIATVTIEVTSDGIEYEQAAKLDDSPANGIAAGDIDGDGRIDAVTADYYSGTVNVLLNETATAPAYAFTAMRFEGGRDPYRPQVADLDGDGHSDIVIAAGSDGVVLLHNRGGTPLEFDAPMYRIVGKVTDVVLADFNRDGKPDIAAVDYGSSEVVVQLNQSIPGTLSFGTSVRLATPTSPYFVAAGDADGAGGPDLVVLSPGSETFSLFVNTMPLGGTTPVFATRADRRTGSQPTGVVLADIDGDQRPDLAVAHEYELWIYANRSTGSVPDFVAARVLDLDRAATEITAFDIDGTGGMDLVIGSTGAQYTFLLNTSGASGFDFDPRDALIGDVATKERAKLGDAGGITVANVDGTGKPELLVTGGSGTFVIFP